jgi:ATP-dependent RNA helicase DeaD
MFSATLPKGAQHIIDSYLDPSYEKVQIENNAKANPLIEHKFLICKIENKVDLVGQFLRDQGSGRGVVFCKTKAGAEKLAKQIASKNYTSGAIHGDLSQKERDKVMRAFKNKKLQVLVATDVAARGIDVEGLSFVLHFQLPEQMENYTHRAGRTGRAGKRGMSVALVLNNEINQVKELEKRLKISFEKIGSKN